MVVLEPEEWRGVAWMPFDAHRDERPDVDSGIDCSAVMSVPSAHVHSTSLMVCLAVKHSAGGRLGPVACDLRGRLVLARSLLDRAWTGPVCADEESLLP